MSDLSAFYSQNVAAEETEEFVVSERFKGKDGSPIPWTLRSISASEDEEFRKAATRRTKGKGGHQVTETVTEEYLAKVAVACVTFPNLKDLELQRSYGVLGAENLLRKMLLAGEYVLLIQKVQEINGYDKDLNDLIEEVKN
ncbi:phage tail assembly chaperone [Cohnella silvisoli]|uniref:Phage portal protein n=1 Tax=Cohnella silvisoli TaxID=2873699 RepID=A0ABV1L4M6_9BACL|nr:phage portal protein [Cohnella silvisoli]MCD9026050.1 phage portal protein [Cohnella silvisoli]